MAVPTIRALGRSGVDRLTLWGPAHHADLLRATGVQVSGVLHHARRPGIAGVADVVRGTNRLLDLGAQRRELVGQTLARVLRLVLGQRDPEQPVRTQGPRAERGHDGGIDSARDADHRAGAAQPVPHLIANPGFEPLRGRGGVEVETVDGLETLDRLQRGGREGRLALEGMEADAFEEVAERKLGILGESLQYLEQ